MGIALAGVLAGACTSSDTETLQSPEPLVVYSGRNKALVGPLLDRFAGRSGVELRVRYASTSELVATLLEEGDRTPADVFISQDAAALGALAAAGRLKPLGDELLVRVDSRYRAPGGEWVGISGRARCLVYAPQRIGPEELPKSLDELGDPRFRGRFGLAPANGSFQAHMAAYRSLRGPEALRALLASLAANEPGRYPNNSAIVAAVIGGEIDFGLTNHYYLWRAIAEDPSVSARNFFPSTSDGSSFVNLAGVGAVSGHQAARTLIEFLLGDEAQRYFAAETYEYPLIQGVVPSADLVPLAEIASPDVDYQAVSAALPSTLAEIGGSGLL